MNRIAGPLALAVVLGGCSWFGGSDVELPAVLVDFEPSAAIKEVWSVNIGTGPDRQFLRLGAARHGDTIYTVDVKGRVRALAQEDGKERWRTDLNLMITGGVGFGDDLVLVASRKGDVVALDKSKGQELWRVQEQRLHGLDRSIRHDACAYLGR